MTPLIGKREVTIDVNDFRGESLPICSSGVGLVLSPSVTADFFTFRRHCL